MFKLLLTLPELASEKKTRMQQPINQKPSHPYWKFYHEATDATKIRRNLTIHDIKKSAKEELNSETNALKLMKFYYKLQ